MKLIGRIVLMAEMHGRDLLRRHAALGLLIALPLCFYLASAGSDTMAPVTGGIGMSFAVSGAALFSILTARAADQRLVLAGYRPVELLLGRLCFLGPLAIALAAAFTALMARLSHPTRIWIVGLGLAASALQAVPFGLAVGAAVPRELEGTLVVIGVIGMQMASSSSAAVSRMLPFYGPKRIIEGGLEHQGALALPVLHLVVYGLALLVVARILISRRVYVRAPGPIAT